MQVHWGNADGDNEGDGAVLHFFLYTGRYLAETVSHLTGVVQDLHAMPLGLAHRQKFEGDGALFPRFGGASCPRGLAGRRSPRHPWCRSVFEARRMAGCVHAERALYSFQDRLCVWALGFGATKKPFRIPGAAAARVADSCTRRRVSEQLEQLAEADGPMDPRSMCRL